MLPVLSTIIDNGLLQKNGIGGHQDVTGAVGAAFLIAICNDPQSAFPMSLCSCKDHRAQINIGIGAGILIAAE